MKKTINWLHVSDLHFGQDKQSFLMPKFKLEFFKDIERLINEIGELHVVFFSGDLSQSGKREEFEDLNIFLEEMWNVFNRNNSNPLLIAVPGNHDMLRQNPLKSAGWVLKNYQIEKDIQNEFWTKTTNNEYLSFIEECYFNFNEWYKNCKMPKPELIYGLIPGDIGVSFSINEIKIGCIGLNSSFLELTNDDYKGKLALRLNQINYLTHNDMFKWLGNNDISILLTHHDPSWYDKDSSNEYNNDFYPPNSFFAHFAGHLHEPSSVQYGSIGDSLRRLQIAPSLFGLEYYNNNLNRIHGYLEGSYTIKADSILEHFWPRRVNMKYGGGYSLGPDLGFTLNNSGYCATEVKQIRPDEVEVESADELINERNVNREISLTDDKENVLNFITQESSEIELDKLPKAHFFSNAHNFSIRIEEQIDFAQKLSSSKYSWLITDWGLNENNFIGSILERLALDSNKHHFFLNCEDILNSKQLVDVFTQQFSVSLQRFCSLINSSGKTSLLVLNHLSPNAFETATEFDKLTLILNSIVDYCPSIYIVIITRQVPHLLGDNYVKLSPLDIPQIKKYLHNHPKADEELLKPQNLEKLHVLTSGLPKHLDKVIDSLRVVSLDELFETELESPVLTIDNESIPKSLTYVINSLSISTDRYTGRTFQLLKVLTILSHGETLSNLKRFYPNEPFFPRNATELEELSLLEVVSINMIAPQFENISEIQNAKLLRVPRQVRDFVNSLISDDEKYEIIKRASDIYLGNKWREGVIKKNSITPLMASYHYYNAENTFVITKNLLLHSIKAEESFELERAAQICVSYCKSLYDSSDYKNSLNSSQDVYYLLKNTELKREKAMITKIYGESVRMASLREKAIEKLNEALEYDSNVFSKSEKISIYIDLAFVFDAQNNSDKAIEYAKKIDEIADENSYAKIDAKAIITKYSYKGEGLLKRLKILESQARKLDHRTTANNLALQIVDLIKKDDIAEKQKFLGKVLKTDNDYNKIRACVKRCLLLVNSGMVEQLVK